MKPQSQLVCEELLQLIERIKRGVLAVAEAHGLTRMQLFSLYSINLHGELGMGQVAEVLGCDASNVTGIIDRLFQQGLVLRTESARDRRTKTIRLTPKGKQLVDELARELPEHLGCEKLDEHDLTTLSALIQKLKT